MRKHYLIALFILLNLVAVTQVVVPVELQYSEIISQQTRLSELNYLSFDKAINTSEFGAFPVYYYEVECPRFEPMLEYIQAGE